MKYKAMKTKILFWLCVFTGIFGQNFYYVNEDFTNVSPGSLPANWVLKDGGYLIDSAPPLNEDTTWTVVSDYSGTTLGNSGNFLMIIDSLPGNFSTINYADTLVLPEFDVSSAASLTFSFTTYLYMSSSGTDSAAIDVFDGTDWVNLERWNALASFVSVGGWANPATKTYDLTSYKNSQLKVRFRFYSNGVWSWWAIDNVQLYKTPLTGIDGYVSDIILPADTFCYGDSIPIEVIIGNNGNTDFNGTLSLGNLSATVSNLNFTKEDTISLGYYVFNTSGNVSLTAILTGNNDIDLSNNTLTKNVYVYPEPSISVGVTTINKSDTLCKQLNVANPYDTIIWSFSVNPLYDSFVSATERCVSWKGNTNVSDSVFVNYYVNYGNGLCFASYQDTIILQTSTSRSNVARARILVYPNPFTEFIIVETEIPQKVRIYDLRGVLIEEKEVQNAGRFLEGAAKSVYILEIGGKRVKVVKE